MFFPGHLTLVELIIYPMPFCEAVDNVCESFCHHHCKGERSCRATGEALINDRKSSSIYWGVELIKDFIKSRFTLTLLPFSIRWCQWWLMLIRAWRIFVLCIPDCLHLADDLTNLRRILCLSQVLFSPWWAQKNRSCVCGYSFWETLVLIKHKDGHVDGVADLDIIIMFCLFIN
jgi:hypothetical protein